MNELDIAGIALYSLPIIPTARRVAWSWASNVKKVSTGDAVWLIFWSMVAGVIWPASLPINLLHESSQSGKDFIVDSFGTAPKRIRQENKVKTLEKRNKELERQLDL